jgi:ABC-type microcin C transport system duplicated ATPase subunit YejF
MTDPGATSGNGAALLEADHLKLHFPIKEGWFFDREVARVHAVDDVTFALPEGETLGLVGESGCGKSTLSRSLLRLLDPTDGAIRFRGKDITAASRRDMQPLRKEMQMVFQDPYASLNPRKRVGQIIGQPLHLHGVERKEVEPRVRELLDRVGLHPEHISRFPHEFSGGQRQRIGVARALALEPKLIPPGRLRAHLPVRRARFERGTPRLRPDRRDVPREAHGGLAGRGALYQADPSIHGCPAGRRAHSGPEAKSRA